MIEVFIESQISMDDTYYNRLSNMQRNRYQNNLVHVPVIKAASTSEAPAVSSSSALATKLAAIPVEEVPKAGDTVVKDTKDVLHRRTLTFTEGQQTRPPPSLATPQPAKKSLVSASSTSHSQTEPKHKPKIWVFDEELTVLRISYQTREWFDKANEELQKKEKEAKNNIAAGTELLDGEVEVVHQSQPKRQRGEPVVIDLTQEDAIVEVASQDISSSTSQDISISTSQDSHTDRKLSTGARIAPVKHHLYPDATPTQVLILTTTMSNFLPNLPLVVPTCPRQGTTLKNYTSIQQNESTMIMTKIQK